MKQTIWVNLLVAFLAAQKLHYINKEIASIKHVFNDSTVFNIDAY